MHDLNCKTSQQKSSVSCKGSSIRDVAGQQIFAAREPQYGFGIFSPSFKTQRIERFPPGRACAGEDLRAGSSLSPSEYAMVQLHPFPVPVLVADDGPSGENRSSPGKSNWASDRAPPRMSKQSLKVVVRALDARFLRSVTFLSNRPRIIIRLLNGSRFPQGITFCGDSFRSLFVKGKTP